ncbi:MAG: peptidoglycan editing factor PgeF [Alphaproteobacteria bacterium]
MFVLRAENLSGQSGTAHAFFGRRGGVSMGVYESLNCALGTRDARENIAENRRRALAALADGPAALLSLYQAHTAQVVTVHEPWTDQTRPRADAMVTKRPGLALGVVTADCASVLLADARAGVIGAAHAGWRGALNGIAEATFAAMVALGARPENIYAAVGPCISQAAYEVGPEFIARFRESNPDNTRYFVPSPREGHWHFDLEDYVATRLAAAELSNIERLSTCTYARAADFFSYRRTTHRQETDFGHQLSAILLRT